MSSYYDRHRLIIVAKQNARNRTKEGRKKARINNWIKLDYQKGDKTWDELYELYINKSNCDRCNVKFPPDDAPKSDRRKRNMTKNRGIICMKCNHDTRVERYDKRCQA